MNDRAHSIVIRLAGIAIVALLAGACDSGSSAGGDAAPVAATGDPTMTIAFRTLSSPTKGDNKVEALVKRTDGTPITDADVAVTFRMPAMPAMNMPEMHSTAPLTHEADGRYVGTGELEMNGTWNVTVTVARPGAQASTARFTVIAK